jgi:signal transduction histidine kinase
VIFDRFSSSKAARRVGGLGLGLYICRQIVREHGGAIRVASTVGKGSSFTVELPTSPLESTPAEEGNPDSTNRSRIDEAGALMER